MVSFLLLDINEDSNGRFSFRGVYGIFFLRLSQTGATLEAGTGFECSWSARSAEGRGVSLQLGKLSSLLVCLEMCCCFLEPLFYGILGSEQSKSATERSFQVGNWRKKAASKEGCSRHIPLLKGKRSTESTVTPKPRHCSTIPVGRDVLLSSTMLRAIPGGSGCRSPTRIAKARYICCIGDRPKLASHAIPLVAWARVKVNWSQNCQLASRSARASMAWSLWSKTAPHCSCPWRLQLSRKR